MNKNILVVIIIFLFIVPVLLFGRSRVRQVPQNTSSESITEPQDDTTLPNPASAYCEENGGLLEILENSAGNQIGVCKFADYSCEEWTYYRGECSVEEDANAIFEALSEKDLNLTGMKVEIKKHFGKYIEGAVVPISEPAGGGYVFAYKADDGMKIVADGNGIIMCEYLTDYPDYPPYLISSCVDSSGNIVQR